MCVDTQPAGVHKSIVSAHGTTSQVVLVDQHVPQGQAPPFAQAGTVGSVSAPPPALLKHFPPVVQTSVALMFPFTSNFWAGAVVPIPTLPPELKITSLELYFPSIMTFGVLPLNCTIPQRGSLPSQALRRSHPFRCIRFHRNFVTLSIYLSG
ncbi:MAG: hypothetical protein UW87_C0026G0005 [Candidatus Moranbacteria bacterium GW2011_GWC2_45_10]|nr:MAG: hypothetical protein UW87_C0026G0005 [Candidatus Moranbacteria bacterium GW2011_GWC2_45_10]